MESLIALLSHPYLITNRVAEAIYADEEASDAIYQRLRARIKKRHRFTVEDYKAVRKVFTAFAHKLDRLANKLETRISHQEQPDLVEAHASSLAKPQNHPYRNWADLQYGLLRRLRWLTLPKITATRIYPHLNQGLQGVCEVDQGAIGSS